MKSIKSVLLLVVLFGAFAIEPAWAHGGGSGRVHFGFAIGAPLVWPYYPAPSYYHPGPSYYYPPIRAVPTSPPVYVEQDPLPAQQSWYFCSNPQGYYPYVKQCPPGWLEVMPQPPRN